jgi:CheY-like chemotaxis protein
MPKNILVIDDDPMVLPSLKKLFNKEGYNMVTAQSGKEALEKVKKTDFDLVVADIKMAGMDGVETATAIKKHFSERNKPEIPIVFITGYADIADQKNAQKLGEVLIKPFDNKELLENVKLETEIIPHKTVLKESQVDKRFSPRIETNFSIRLFPDVEANVIDISETGIRFDCKGPVLPEDILLLMDVSTSKLKQPSKISAKVIWRKSLPENKSQIGAHFSLLDKDHFSQIRDFIFNSFAKKASSGIKDEDLKVKVEEFFNKTIRQYHEKLSVVVQETSVKTHELEDAEEKLTSLTNDLLLKCEALAKIVDNNLYMKRIKQTFREITSCWFYKSPIIKMAYDRPRGYPGDFELFEIIYNNKPIAENKTFGFYCDKFFLNNAYAMAARARKNKMKNILQDFMENRMLSTIRLLNVACGPSREIRELVADPLLMSGLSGKKIIFTGLDNDKDSLRFSKSALGNLPPNFETRFLHENVLDIFRDDKYYDLIGKQDIIYILGLTEYLPDRIFKRLLRFLYQLLNEKGMLVVTYKDKEITFPSIGPDWISDWDFIKRGKDDLIKAAKELGVGENSLKIEREGTGTIFFVKISKS